MNPYYNPDFDKLYTPPAKVNNNLANGINAGLGVIGLGANAYQMAHQNPGFGQLNIPTQYGMDQRPGYGLGEQYNQVATFKPQHATGGEVAAGAVQGASAGSAFGPIGAGVGALVGGLTSIFAGNAREKKQEQAQESALKKLQAGQNAYNSATSNYLNQQNAQEELYNKTNRYNRMNNLYA